MRVVGILPLPSGQVRMVQMNTNHLSFVLLQAQDAEKPHLMTDHLSSMLLVSDSEDINFEYLYLCLSLFFVVTSLKFRRKWIYQPRNGSKTKK